jgi:hypothetical protein
MVMNRVRVVWSGLGGLPGLSTFYMDTATSDPTAIRTFFDAIKTQFPSPLTWQVENSGDKVNEINGEIVGSWAGPAQTVVSGISAAAYSAPSGAIVRWITGAVVDGRRPTGRTFLVPLLSSAYDSSGTLSSTAVTTIQGAATALVSALALKVWHRPKAGTGGQALVITSALVPDKAYVLRRRRD